jgi:shikimate dehydrogenase
MPYKEKIYNIVDELDESASIVKSVNTVKFLRDGKVSIGYNTDINGVLLSINNKGFDWTNKECLVIGAGGAARSAIFTIIKQPVKKLYIYNRTQKKVKKILNTFSNILYIYNRTQKKVKKILNTFSNISNNKIEIVRNLNNIESKIDNIDLIINCTPLGMDMSEYKDLSPIPDDWNLKNKYIFDMVYNPVETKLIKKGMKDGAKIITGIDMLINQAAFSFKIWFNILPNTRNIKNII